MLKPGFALTSHANNRTLSDTLKLKQIIAFVEQSELIQKILKHVEGNLPGMRVNYMSSIVKYSFIYFLRNTFQRLGIHFKQFCRLGFSQFNILVIEKTVTDFVREDICKADD